MRRKAGRITVSIWGLGAVKVWDHTAPLNSLKCFRLVLMKTKKKMEKMAKHKKDFFTCNYTLYLLNTPCNRGTGGITVLSV